MLMYGRIIAKPQYSVFFPCSLMMQKETQHKHTSTGGKFSFLESCESNAPK